LRYAAEGAFRFVPETPLACEAWARGFGGTERRAFFAQKVNTPLRRTYTFGPQMADIRRI